MKILINASTLVVGGGVQVALNLIKNTLKNKKHDFYYIISKELFEQLDSSIEEKKYCVINISPAKRIKGIPSRKLIKSIEKEFLPDIVYSVGAPSYIFFKTKEVLRLTNSWLFSDSKLAFSTYPFLKKHSTRFILFIQRFYIRKKNYIITQTEVAKNDISKRFNIKKDKIYVVPNVYSSIFDIKIEDIKKVSNKTRIFCFAAPYNHKNIEIIPEVAKELENKGVKDFEFLVTIPPDFNAGWSQKFHQKSKGVGVDRYIKNLGKVNFEEAPRLYQESDILFLPTLFETFSVTYLEAMASGVPIVTTNLPFAKEVCGDAALYFKPKDPKEAANRIFELIMNKDLQESLILSGQKKIKTFAKENEVYSGHLKVLEQIHSR
ncbi:glycosyltransferase family 1 protein [Aquimarina sp. 2201CG1-2-11]|uniref:glycosyltransferase family 4 protein n=1 Tax=Aquimarina discodermiae TaxID=3231043 RepID=UPI0034631A14